MQEKLCYFLIHQFLRFLQDLPAKDVASLEAGTTRVEIRLAEKATKGKAKATRKGRARTGKPAK
jgi:hypothetical protein